VTMAHARILPTLHLAGKMPVFQKSVVRARVLVF
jgi:hypothetical protein